MYELTNTAHISWQYFGAIAQTRKWTIVESKHQIWDRKYCCYSIPNIHSLKLNFSNICFLIQIVPMFLCANKTGDFGETKTNLSKKHKFFYDLQQLNSWANGFHQVGQKCWPKNFIIQKESKKIACTEFHLNVQLSDQRMQSLIIEFRSVIEQW